MLAQRRNKKIIEKMKVPFGWKAMAYPHYIILCAFLETPP